MSDCPNVAIRERLPEYLHGTLSAASRSEVAAHLATCEDCTAELALLRMVREAHTQAARPVNVSAIVSALPRRATRPVAVRSWRRSHAFQIAAAVSFIALGGISLTVARSFFNGTSTVAQVDSAIVPGNGTSTLDTPISFAGGVSDLGDEDIEALISALEQIEAMPVTEPSDPPLSGVERQGS